MTSIAGVGRRIGWCIGLAAIGSFVSPVRAEDEWAVLGHELGCYKIATLRDGLVDDVPKLKTLERFSTPDEFVRQLETLGVHPTKKAPRGGKGTPMHGIVIVEFDGRSVAFVKRRNCTSFED